MNKKAPANGNGVANSSNGHSVPGMEYRSLTGSELTNDFDTEWAVLSPENAQPLKRKRAEFNFKNSQEWIRSAEIFLLPFHNFSEDRRLNIRFHRKLTAANLKINWLVLYPHVLSGSAPIYEADLFILKRKIYEQGDDLKDSIEINLSAALAPLVKKYQNIEEFERLFELNLLINASLAIKRHRTPSEESHNKQLNNLTEHFKRFKDLVTRSEKNSGNDWETMLRVQLDEYWLDWLEVARRAKFNFDYLEPLQPVEMRFYELVQLLRFRKAQEPVEQLETARLEVSYSEFSKLMPLSRLKTQDEVENQLNEICQVHLRSGYLKDISIKTINRKGKFADARLITQF